MSENNGTATAEKPASTPAAKPAGFGPVAGVSKDRDGRVFDAAKFLPEKDGNGRWKRVGGPGKPGRPKGSKNAPAAGETPKADFSDVERIAAASPDGAEVDGAAAGGGGDSGGVKVRDEFDAAAVATVSGISTVGILAMGAHVAPTPDEISAMVKAYAECFRAYGYAPKTPPWLGPVIATAVWMGPHLSDQRTQTKLQGWKIRLGAIWAKFRGRRDARAAASAAADAGAV